MHVHLEIIEHAPFLFLDFLGDVFQKESKGKNRFIFCILTLLPPLMISGTYPNLFVKVFSFAAGYGEAALNGLFPVAILYLGIYRHNRKPSKPLKGGMLTLATLAALTFLIMGIESWFLLKH